MATVLTMNIPDDHWKKLLQESTVQVRLEVLNVVGGIRLCTGIEEEGRRVHVLQRPFFNERDVSC